MVPVKPPLHRTKLPQYSPLASVPHEGKREISAESDGTVQDRSSPTGCQLKGTRVERIYLYVPPEERAEVEALGARWDDKVMCWYIGADEDAAGFVRWFPSEDEEGFTITSEEAYVASATTACERCHSKIEVICIHCESGSVADEPLTRFTVSNVWAVDDVLARQLQEWPTFRKEQGSNARASRFANHCSHCGALLVDLYLHSEPGQPFFCVPRAPAGSIKLTPIVGRVQFSGDGSFEV
jgi:Domain of unknown function (DUF5710)